jgi:hypothetical protein
MNNQARERVKEELCGGIGFWILWVSGCWVATKFAERGQCETKTPDTDRPGDCGAD